MTFQSFTVTLYDPGLWILSHCTYYMMICLHTIILPLIYFHIQTTLPYLIVTIELFFIWHIYAGAKWITRRVLYSKSTNSNRSTCIFENRKWRVEPQTRVMSSHPGSQLIKVQAGQQAPDDQSQFPCQHVQEFQVMPVH